MAPLSRLIILTLGLLTGAGAPASLTGQQEEPVALAVLPEDGSLRLRLGDLLQEGGLREALESGLPIRILVQAQLWKDRFFDSQEGSAEWRASVRHDPLDRTYRVQAGGSPSMDVTLETLEQARLTLQQSFDLPLRPREDGVYYYLVRVELETLSLSDLEELQRWLRGELGPAVRGDSDVEGAVARGFRRLFARVLGLPTRRVDLRSSTFRIPPDEGGGQDA